MNQTHRIGSQSDDWHCMAIIELNNGCKNRLIRIRNTIHRYLFYSEKNVNNFFFFLNFQKWIKIEVTTKNETATNKKRILLNLSKTFSH